MRLLARLAYILTLGEVDLMPVVGGPWWQPFSGDVAMYMHV